MILAHFLNRHLNGHGRNLFIIEKLYQMRKKKKGYMEPIIGIIIANEWDTNGNITGVAIYSDNEEIYFIYQKKCLQNLLDKIQKRVRVKGEIIQLPGGRKRIDISFLQEMPTIDNHINNIHIPK
jgi:hypothetical protein